MQFSTKIQIQPNTFQIEYHSNLLLLGSCFAQNIAQQLDFYKFKSVCNPFGIIFNPISIQNLLERAINNVEFTENDVFFQNDCWHCYEIHSELNHPNAMDFLKNCNQKLLDLKNQVQFANHIVITYGTSWVYQLKETATVVANCHKMPQQLFEKKILSIADIAQSIHKTLEMIRFLNPNCNFIFTISPVRHLKDGFIENQISKSHLIAALHQVLFETNNPKNYYFPAFEILLDELRDYRFYANDMLHPNELAIEYIWNHFVNTCISKSCEKTMQQVYKIQKGLLHKPFNINSESHQKFLKKLSSEIKQLQTIYGFIDFEMTSNKKIV